MVDVFFFRGKSLEIPQLPGDLGFLKTAGFAFFVGSRNTVSIRVHVLVVELRAMSGSAKFRGLFLS